MTKIYGYDTNVYETSIGNIKDMIEPIQDWKVWKYSCTDEEVKRAMTDKSYIEIILEEKDKEIKRLQFELDKTRLNELEKEYRIYKAISYMNNTYEINDLKELFNHYNNVEAILKGNDKEN